MTSLTISMVLVFQSMLFYMIQLHNFPLRYVIFTPRPISLYLLQRLIFSNWYFQATIYIFHRPISFEIIAANTKIGQHGCGASKWALAWSQDSWLFQHFDSKSKSKSIFLSWYVWFQLEYLSWYRNWYLALRFFKFWFWTKNLMFFFLLR